MPEPLLLRNARVLTQNPSAPYADSVYIEAGRIVYVGPESALSVPHVGVRVIDLDGKSLIPGFNDCHMHILPYGLDLAKADLSPAAGVLSVPSLIKALREWVTANPRSEWALGNRYDQNTFPGAAHPTKWELDAAFPDRPVMLMQTSKHAGTANSVALRLAGITRETPDPDAGEIVRDSNGEATGVLLETAVELVSRLVPIPDKAGLVAAIQRANAELVKAGVTSASDLNTGWLDMRTEIGCYVQAANEGAPVRTTLFPDTPQFGKPEDVPNRDAFLADTALRGAESAILGGVRLGAAKLFSDGALTVRTAAMREPYVDGGGVGMLLHPPEELSAYISTAHARGWQVAVHAIGDRAVELVLDCYRDAQSRNPRPGARQRVEHAMLLDQELVRRFKEQEVIPVIQPEFITRLGDAYVLGLGLERASRLNPVATLQRAGISVPFSSDCPIVPGKPLDGIRAAVRRVTRSGRRLGAEEETPAAAALRNYTYWAAYASFDEGEAGTIAPGMRADLTVLSGDPTEDNGLDSIEVVATIVGGEVVYGADGLE